MAQLMVHVIIVTYNGTAWVEACLESLRQSAIPVKVIAVDNCSSDGTPDLIRRDFPEVDLLQSGQNLGFGKANNLGIKKALTEGADYVFLLNQDASIEPDTIDELIKAHLRNQRYGILSPIHLNGQGDALDPGFCYSLVPLKYPEIFFDALTVKEFQPVYEVPSVNAAAWLLPKSTLETVGGFDPIFFHYGEDINYVQRVKYHQLKIGICPKGIIYHDRDFQLNRKQRTERKKEFLLRFANININGPEALKKEKALKWKWLFLSLFRFKMNNVKKVKEELDLLNDIEHLVITSWKTNQNPGLNYLEIKSTELESTIR